MITRRSIPCWQDHVLDRTTLHQDKLLVCWITVFQAAHHFEETSVVFTYLCFMLLSLSANVELNPGHVDFPHGNCALEVLDLDPAVECDECGDWFHIPCQCTDQDTYADWVAAEYSFSLTCSNCDHPNLSSVTQSSFASYEPQNNFSVLIDESSYPRHSIDPSPTIRVAQLRRDPSTKLTKLRVLNVNCQSLLNKKQNFTAS